MKRERWLRWYGHRYWGFVELIPSIGVSWSEGRFSLHGSWLVWAGELEVRDE